MARTREEGLETRILEASMAVFGEKGFQATTLKDIAAVAGISAASIYTYFADKQALFAASAAWGWDRFSADLEDLATSSLSVEERIQTLLGSGFSALTKALPLLRGMLFDASRHDLVRPGLERVIDSIDSLLAPKAGSEAVAGPQVAGARRALVEIFVTGILFSAGLGRPETAEADLEGLRLAVLAFLDLIDGYGRKAETPAGLGSLG